LVSGLDLQVTTVSAKEKHRLMAQLQGAANATAESVLAETYYRVTFENVLDLVAKRAVVLRDGWAYVPSEAQIVLVVNAFKKHLESALAETAKALPALEDDDRLHDMMRAVASQHLQSEYVASGSKNGVVGAADVDRLVNLFPPCMRQLHTHLRQDGHLRHQGRLQYWLFLKGIGMPVEEALTFWRKAFYRLTDDQFQKQYAYNLRPRLTTRGAPG
ncbi:DNA primase, large subunit, partial [Caulochytrium protostelioides]